MTKKDKVAKVMHEWKAGTLTSNGKQVTDYDQAVAIALSEAGLSKYAEGGGVGLDNFYVKSNFGNWAVTDRRNNKMVVGYSKKEDAIITAKGLNDIDNSEELNETISKLKTMKGYGHFLNQYAEGGEISDLGFAYLADLWFAVQQKDTEDYEKLSKSLDEEGVSYKIQNEVSADASELRGRRSLSISEVHDRIKKILTKDLMEKGGDMNEYSKGGNIIERRYVNKDEDYETKYAKNKPSRMGYKDERKFEGGGGIKKYYDVFYSIKGGGSMIAKNIEASSEEEAKEKLTKQMRASSTFDKPITAIQKFAEGGAITDKSWAKINETLWDKGEIMVIDESKFGGEKVFSVENNLTKDVKEFEDKKEAYKYAIEKSSMPSGTKLLYLYKLGYEKEAYEIRKASENSENSTFESFKRVMDKVVDSKNEIYSNKKFAVGGEIGNQVTFSRYGERTTGRVTDKLRNGYEVVTDEGTILVEPQEVISFSETPIAKKKRFGFFEGGGSIEEYKQAERDYDKYGEYLEDAIEDENEADIKKYKRLMDEAETRMHRYERKYEGGGEIENKIEKLKKVVSSKMLPESVKAKAQAEIDKLEKELHESKETKAEEKAEENKMTGESEGERNVGMDEEKDYIEAKTKALEKSLKDKNISETQRKRDEKELALFKGAEAKKPTTRKAPVRKAVVKKTEVKAKFKVDDIVGTDKDDALAKKITSFKTNRKGEVIYSGYYISKPSEKFSFEESELVSIKAPAKPKADHKKLVAKLKAKKGGKEYDNRASLVPFTETRRNRSESSDKKRSALPPGKRVSENGVTYYESRLNRTDLSKEDKFEDGGEVKGSDWGLNLNW